MGEEPVFHPACFVVTHRSAETIFRKDGTSYTFVTDGIPAALDSARQAAGSEDVMVGGGADIAQQFLNAGLVDEVRLHVVPVVLGSGARLFDGVQPGTRLIPRAAQTEAAVTHLLYAAERAA